jgi:hypothetical protein
MTCTLHENLYTFLIVSGSFLIRMTNVAHKTVEAMNINILCSITFIENRAVYELLRKNMVLPERPKTTIITAHAHSMQYN